MSKNGLYEHLTSDQIEVSNFPRKENYDEDERVSNTSFHSL